MINEIFASMNESVEKTLDAYKKQLASIRTGRAHGSLLDSVKVDYYGVKTGISQMAAITVSDPRTLVIKPFEKGQQKSIEKAILEANLGLTAVTDGDIVRVPVPALTEERRKDFVKQAKTRAEEAKLAVRNARRDSNEMLHQSTKDKEMTEDDEKRGLKMVQDATDAAIRHIEDLLNKKEDEIMKV